MWLHANYEPYKNLAVLVGRRNRKGHSFVGDDENGSRLGGRPVGKQIDVTMLASDGVVLDRLAWLALAHDALTLGTVRLLALRCAALASARRLASLSR